jgi:hypothetical protein
VWIFEAQVMQKPPLRPLAPLPQKFFSTTATSSVGSSSFRRSAVHRPVKPPPRMATSARSSPSSASVSSGLPPMASLSQ